MRSLGNGSVGAAHIDGRCRVSSNDGEINVAGRFDLLDVNSDDGTINMALPTDFKANLDARTSDGHITLNLPVQVQGDISKSHVRGTLNGAGNRC